MKKTVVAMSLALIFSGHALAETEQVEQKQETTTPVNALESQVSTADLLTAVNPPPKKEGRLHGTLSSKIEIEQWRYDDQGKDEGMRNGGKVKYVLAEGNFRHDDLPGWDFGFHSSREDIFEGEPLDQDYQMNNSILEIYANRNYNKDWGNIGWGVKLGSESADDRWMPEVKGFGSYKITDKLDVHGYALYHIEHKRGQGDFNYFEIEPGFGYQIADNMGAWLNFRYQHGTWVPNSNSDKEVETEVIVKPGVWYGFGKLSASLWGEFGKFEKENDRTGAHLWKEDYWKLGVSANYPLSKQFRLVGELSYKSVEFENTANTKFDGYLPFGMIGINYSF